MIIGPTEPVPVSIVGRGHIPSREQVSIPRDDTVKGSGGGDQLLAGGGASDPADQIIDRGILDAGNIDRIALVGEPRSPVELLLLPRKVRGAEELKRHVEVEINPGPPLELGRVDDPQPGIDTRLS